LSSWGGDSEFQLFDQLVKEGGFSFEWGFANVKKVSCKDKGKEQSHFWAKGKGKKVRKISYGGRNQKLGYTRPLGGKTPGRTLRHHLTPPKRVLLIISRGHGQLSKRGGVVEGVLSNPGRKKSGRVAKQNCSIKRKGRRMGENRGKKDPLSSGERGSRLQPWTTVWGESS